MSLLVYVQVDLALMSAVRPGGNNRLGSDLASLGGHLFRVAGSVSKQKAGPKPLYERDRRAAIRRGTRRDKESDRHTMRIHGHMYLGVEPPFVCPTPSDPPRAPVPSWRALT